MTIRTPPVPATLVETLFPGEDGRSAPGSFKLYSAGDEPTGLNFRCPCGCDAIFGVRFRTEGTFGGWDFNGDLSAPTLHPSVSCSVRGGEDGSVEHWHGWLRSGVWVSV